MGDLWYVYLIVSGTEITAIIEGKQVFAVRETVTIRSPDN